MNHFFLASNSPKGFFSKMEFFDKELPEGWKCNVIKGGPGCGKSTYMKKVASEIEDMGFDVEYIHCPSDPFSLDAIISHDLKTCYVDGTAPHVIDPVYPGISGKIINLGETRKVNKLSKDKIYDLDLKSKELRNQSQKYLIAFRSILSNSIEKKIKTIEVDFLNKVSREILKKVPKKSFPKKCKKTVRMISSMGPEGLLFFNLNFENTKYLYEIQDDLNLASDIIMRKILDKLEGHNVIICLNPISFNEKIEALIFPELSFAIFAKNRWQIFSDSEEYKSKKIKVKSKLIYDDIYVLDLLMEKSKKCLKDCYDLHCDIEKAFYLE